MPQELLTPVAAGQTRFRMQGLSPDARGIALGRELLVTVDTLDRLVAFLGAYSDESNLDDLLTTLTIERGVRPGGGGAFILRFAGTDGYGADRVGRLTAAVRGTLYTGASSMFVRWRGRDAPFGYDLAQSVPAQDADVVLVDMDRVTRYQIGDRIDPVDLIWNLQVRPVPVPLAAADGLIDLDEASVRDMALALVAPGLSDRVISYLWRAREPFAGYPLQLPDDVASSVLLRLRRPTARVVDVLRRTPGVAVFAPVSARVAVEIGFRHPIELRSASGCFPGEDVFLFRGKAARVTRVAGPPRFVDGRHLVTADGLAANAEVTLLGEGEIEPLKVDLRLRPSSLPREPRGVLVPWDRAAMLRKLVYLIPPSALASARLSVLREGLLVLTSALVGGRKPSAAALSAGSIVPLGRRLCEAAPGVLVPDGFEPWPRVRPALLRELLSLDSDDHAVFLEPDAAPLKIPSSALLALDAAVLARIPAAAADLAADEIESTDDPELKNASLSRFALWGVGRSRGPDTAERPALGPAPQEDA